MVTPSRYEKPAEQEVKDVEVTKKKEIENKGDKTLSEVINDSPGVISTQTGGYRREYPDFHPRLPDRAGADHG